MVIVPLQPVASQTVSTILNDQSCQVSVYQKFYGLFIDVYINNSLVIGGVLCCDLNRIVRSQYLGFVGDLVFIDTLGTLDPHYEGLGSRYLLLYVEPGEL